MRGVIITILVGIVIAAAVVFVLKRPKSIELRFVEQKVVFQSLEKTRELNEHQLKRMAIEIFKPFNGDRSHKKIAVARSTHFDIKGVLQITKPGSWKIYDRGRPDLIVSGYFFHSPRKPNQTSALFLFLIDWKTGKILAAASNYLRPFSTLEKLTQQLQKRQPVELTVEVIDQSQDQNALIKALSTEKLVNLHLEWIKVLAVDIHQDLVEKWKNESVRPNPAQANANLIISRAPNRRIALELNKMPPNYEMIAIQIDYINDKLTQACQNLSQNLVEFQKKETLSALVVAVINSQKHADGSLVALTLQHMVAAMRGHKKMAGMTLLGTSYTNEHGERLRQALQDQSDISDDAIRVVKKHQDLAVLSVKRGRSPEVFNLELSKLSGDRVLLATSTSMNLEIFIDSQPEPAAIHLISPNGDKTDLLGTTSMTIEQKQITDYGITHGTKIQLTLPGGQLRTYVHPTDGAREDDEDERAVYYRYLWYR